MNIKKQMRRTRDKLRRQRDWRPGVMLIPAEEIQAAAHCDHTMGPEDIVSVADQAIMEAIQRSTQQ